jgi:pyruvate dehydrogenase E2 component (dihydrolipoamide acetyltransferase)
MPDVPVRMPKMSMTMTEGEVIGWRVAPGDTVAAGDVVCEVMTDKVDMEVEAPAGGVVREILVADGVVEVGTPIAVIDSADADAGLDLLDDGPPPEATPRVGPPAASPAASPAEPGRLDHGPVAQVPTRAAPPAPRPAGPVPAVPRARALARETGVDLGAVPGSGPGGLVTVADVEAARGTARPARDVRLAVARRMAAAAGVPQVSVGLDLDVEDVEDGRNDGDVAGGRDGVPGPATPPDVRSARLLAALATALRSVPDLTRTWTDGGLGAPVPPGAPLGVALAVPTARGTVAAAFADPDTRGLGDLAAAVARAVSQARRGRLAPEHLVPAVATVAPLTGGPVERYRSVVAPPQSLVLTAAGPHPRPVATAGGGVAWRRHLSLDVTVDHRVGDGALAAVLLESVAAALGGRAAGRGAAT